MLLGTKGIALSATAGRAEIFKKIIPYVEETLALLIESPGLSLFNVNFPPEPRGIKWTKQSVRFYDGQIVPGRDPMGRKHYWFTVIRLEPAEEGTDRWATEKGYVSITPLRLDLTDMHELKRRQDEHPL